MEVQIAVAKVNKYASLESGDTLETIERPNGGFSVVLADGQTSGHGAKAISMMVVRKVIGLASGRCARWRGGARRVRCAVYGEKRKSHQHAQYCFSGLAQRHHRSNAQQPLSHFYCTRRSNRLSRRRKCSTRNFARCPPHHHRDRNRIGIDHRHFYRRFDSRRRTTRRADGCLRSDRIPARRTGTIRLMPRYSDRQRQSAHCLWIWRRLCWRSNLAAPTVGQRQPRWNARQHEHDSSGTSERSTWVIPLGGQRKH